MVTRPYSVASVHIINESAFWDTALLGGNMVLILFERSMPPLKTAQAYLLHLDFG